MDNKKKAGSGRGIGPTPQATDKEAQAWDYPYSQTSISSASKTNVVGERNATDGTNGKGKGSFGGESS
jgi:hypothetical protein